MFSRLNGRVPCARWMRRAIARIEDPSFDPFYVFYRVFGFVINYGLKVLGPLLICFAMSIICGLLYVYFGTILPVMKLGYFGYVLHVSLALFLLFNVLFNYAMCSTTRHSGDHYQAVVRELAEVTNFTYPENQAELKLFVDTFRRKFGRERASRASQSAGGSGDLPQPGNCGASANGNTGGGSHKGNAAPSASSQSSKIAVAGQKELPVDDCSPPSTETSASDEFSAPSWMSLGPQEWSYCTKSRKPKPPRSHFDHASRDLVLNMDHFCPWMANCIGYFNYR